MQARIIFQDSNSHAIQAHSFHLTRSTHRSMMMTKAYYSYSSPPITFSPTTSSSTKREGLRFCSTERTLFGIAKVLYEGEEVGRTKNTKHCTIKQSIAVSVEKRVGRMMGSSSDDFGPLPSLFIFNNIYIYIYLFFRYRFFLLLLLLS